MEGGRGGDGKREEQSKSNGKEMGEGMSKKANAESVEIFELPNLRREIAKRISSDL